MNVRDLLLSVVRTTVPAVVALILAGLTKVGIDIDGALLSGLVDGLLVGGYYAAARFLESKWSWFGVLLGWKAQPTYKE
jgi:hypothetical protein